MSDFLLWAHVVVRTSSLKISRRYLAGYIKKLHQKPCRTVSSQSGSLSVMLSLALLSTFLELSFSSLLTFCHTLWLSLCLLVLRFLIVQWLPFHSTPVRSHFRWPPLFLEGKFFSSFLNISWLLRLPYLQIMVYWLIYHNGQANQKSWIALSNDPVFNNNV